MILRAPNSSESIENDESKDENSDKSKIDTYMLRNLSQRRIRYQCHMMPTINYRDMSGLYHIDVKTNTHDK